MDFLFGSTGSNTTTQTTTNALPKYLEDPVKDILKRGEVLSNRNYTPYGNERLAEFSDDTNTAFDMIRDQAAGGNRALTNGAAATTTALSRFDPQNVSARNVTTSTFNPGADLTTNRYANHQFDTGAPIDFASFANRRFDTGAGIETAHFANRRFDTGANLETANFRNRSFTDQNVGAYMDPYIDNVLGAQQDMATRRFQEQQAGRDASAVAAGAFGGDRRFVADSLAQRDMNEQMNLMQQQGLSSAFNTAASLINTDEARRLSAFEADQDRSLEAQTFNKDYRLKAYEGDETRRLSAFEADQGRSFEAQKFNKDFRFKAYDADEARRLAAFEADQGRYLDTQKFNKDYRFKAYDADEARRLAAFESDEDRALKAGEFNKDYRFGAYNADATRRLTADTGNADRGLEAQRLNAVNDIAGAGLRLDAAGQMGDLANLRQDMTLQDAEALSAVGSRIQGRDQAGLDLAYQDFLRQQGFPEDQLSFYATLLAGQPRSTTSTTATSTPQPSFLSQLAGVATTGFGIYDLFNRGGGQSPGGGSAT